MSTLLPVTYHRVKLILIDLAEIERIDSIVNNIYDKRDELTVKQLLFYQKLITEILALDLMAYNRLYQLAVGLKEVVRVAIKSSTPSQIILPSVTDPSTCISMIKSTLANIKQTGGGVLYNQPRVMHTRW